MASPEAEPVPGPKKKRLPFKRTAPRQTPVEKAADGDSENNDIEFFRRTNDIMPMALQDVNRSPTPEQKPPPQRKGSFHLSPDKRERKRVKISPDSDECDRVNSLQAPAPASKRPAAVSLSDDSDSEDLIMDVKGKGKEIIYRTPTKRKISNPGASSASALRLTDSDDDVKPTRTPLQPPKTPTSHKTRPPPRGSDSGRRGASPVLLDLSDDDERDIKLQVANLDADSSDSDLVELTGPPDPKEEENNDDELAYWIQQAKALEEETQNVIVTVIVTSRIAGTKPVMIRRRLNQVIRPVLETWIDRQRGHNIDVPEDVERGMFLTWKGHKVYSSSTLASLGIPVDPATGTVKPNRDGGFRQDMLHIEVWTEEAWADHLREMEQQRKLQIGIYDDDDSGGDGAANPAAKDELAVAEKKYNVRLKSQDQVIPCTISPSYTVKEIIEMFREVATLGEDRDISIWFDGEQLDEDALAVEAAELEPDEISQLEVRVK
ncbi:hypothetical protein B0T18DRAFT_429727 [Schizothecium vesticola]|uniref:Rad60/SUMO-like domain-containing protein n=1 Tax=Schizothecium vesticola TaxID=314040 RepID=A0AA40EWG8_9PEZI|nr:hypothetical protein B0T18DRAFT_429727 [Schizothecium vesticola]